MPLFKRLTRAAAPIVFWLCPQGYVEGKRVIFTDLTVPRDRCLTSLEEVLRLLEEIDPRNYQRVLRYARHFVVWGGRNFATDHLGGIQVPAAPLQSAEFGQLAAALVHEATQRIERHGIAACEANIARVERRCVREEASFLRRIPGDGEEWATDAEAALATAWWTQDARKTHLERTMSDVGVPNWLRPLVRRLR